MEEFDADPRGLEYRRSRFAAVICPGENPLRIDRYEEISKRRFGNHADCLSFSLSRRSWSHMAISCVYGMPRRRANLLSMERSEGSMRTETG